MYFLEISCMFKWSYFLKFFWVIAFENTPGNKNMFKIDDKKTPELLQVMLFGCLKFIKTSGLIAVKESVVRSVMESVFDLELWGSLFLEKL